MIIGVDAGCLGVEDDRLKVGVYQVAMNLLQQLGEIDGKNNYYLYSFNPIPPQVMRRFGRRMKNVILRPTKGWFHLRLPLEFLLRKPDVFLALGQAMPGFHPFKTIGFVYDLAFEFYPNCYPKSLDRLRRNTKRLVKKADCLIAISKSSKRDLVRVYGVTDKKIKVFYPGVSSVFNSNGGKKLFGKPYFLFIGALKRSKNVPFILRSFAKFVKKQEKNRNFYLVIGGGDYWLDPEIEEIIEKFDLKKQVFRLGFVAEGELPKLYRGAEALIAPSLYEGFGLSSLEAMACGCPVITSKRGAMTEVVDGAGILVDPTREEELVKAMKRVTESEKVKGMMIKNGLRRSRKFSWKKFAQGVMEVINENCHC